MPDKHDVYLKVLMLPVSFGKTLSFKKITKGSPGTRGGRPGLAFKVLRLKVSKRKSGSRRYSSFLAPSEITTS